MDRFSLGTLSDWTAVKSGVFEFDVENSRTLEFEIHGARESLAVIFQDGVAFPVGRGHSYSVKCTVTRDAVLLIEPQGTSPVIYDQNKELIYFDDVFVKIHTASQLVVSDEEAYTNIAPMISSSSDMDRLLRIQALNQQLRDAQWASAMEAQNAKIAELVEINARKQTPQTAPPAQPVSEGTGGDGTSSD